MKLSKVKALQIRKAHYLTSLIVTVVAFGAIGVILEFVGNAATQSNVEITSAYGSCLDDYDASGQVGAKITVYKCSTSDTAQLWKIDTVAHTISVYGLCIGTSGNATAAGTNVVLNKCSTTGTEQWENLTNGNLINLGAGRKCLNAPSGTYGVQLTIVACAATPPTGQIWHHGPPAPTPPPPPPAPTPTPTPTPPPPSPAPSPAPSPSPTPTPAPTPTPTPTPPPPSGGVSLTGDSGTSGTSLAINNSLTSSATSTPLSGSSTTNSPTATIDIQSNPPGTNTGKPNPKTKPVISHLAVATETTSSVSLSWQSNIAANYVLRYGTHQNHLTSVQVLKTSGVDIKISIKNLPANTRIYASLTPYNNTLAGTTQRISFKTKPHSLLTPIIIILGFSLVIIIVLIKLIGRKPVVPPHQAFTPPSTKQSAEPSNDELPYPDTPPVIPQENQVTYNRRVNWWMPEKMQQTGLPEHHHKATDDQYPDMFEEGRKRLDEEEKDNKLPKE